MNSNNLIKLLLINETIEILSKLKHTSEFNFKTYLIIFNI